MKPTRPYTQMPPHQPPTRLRAPSRLAGALFATALAGSIMGLHWSRGASTPRPGAAWALASFSVDAPPDDHSDDHPDGSAVAPSQSQNQGPPQDQQQEGIRECVITLLSGRKITGELVRQDSLIVVIGINGIDTTFQKKNVAQVKVLAPVAERYKEMRAAITDDDIDDRLSLVEWLRARKSYALALKELDSILIIDPQNPRAKLLHTWLAEHDKLRRADPEQTHDAQKPEQSPTDDNAQRTYKIERNDIPTLTPEQINLMRVYEIDLRNPPRIAIPDEVLTELMTRSPEAFSPNQDERKAVYQLPEIDKLKLLFTLKARDLYPKVQVLEDPESLQRFKDDVHNRRGWLINACASTRCHGGVDAGSFRLLNTKPNSDETAFTNLYIIEHSTLADGTPLINYKAPDRSPLLQMGMVTGNALTPHPEIPRGFPGTGWRPIFRTTRDRKYKQALDWIRSMYQPRPDYGFDIPQAQPDADQRQSPPGPDATNPDQKPPSAEPNGP